MKTFALGFGLASLLTASAAFAGPGPLPTDWNRSVTSERPAYSQPVRPYALTGDWRTAYDESRVVPTTTWIGGGRDARTTYAREPTARPLPTNPPAPGYRYQPMYR